MANQPLAFAELMAGGVLVLAGVSGSNIAEVIKGTFTWPPKSLVPADSTGSGTVSGSDIGPPLTPSSQTVKPTGSNGTYSFKDLEQLWVNAGGQAVQAPVMAAIALAESSGNPTNTHLNTNGTVDSGLWQINSVHGYNQNDLFNPQFNATAALAVFNSQGLDAWATYTSQAYKHFLPGG